MKNSEAEIEFLRSLVVKENDGSITAKLDGVRVCPSSLAGCFGRSGESNYRVVSRKKLVSIFDEKDRKRGPGGGYKKFGQADFYV